MCLEESAQLNRRKDDLLKPNVSTATNQPFNKFLNVSSRYILRISLLFLSNSNEIVSIVAITIHCTGTLTHILNTLQIQTMFLIHFHCNLVHWTTPQQFRYLIVATDFEDAPNTKTIAHNRICLAISNSLLLLSIRMVKLNYSSGKAVYQWFNSISQLCVANSSTIENSIQTIARTHYTIIYFASVNGEMWSVWIVVTIQFPFIICKLQMN